MRHERLKRPIGKIQLAIKEALALRDGLLRDGNTVAETDRIVGQGLKAVLENPRPEPWRFVCRDCHDTGWIDILPTSHELDRVQRIYGPTEGGQPYVSKCDPCPHLAIERRSRRRRFDEPDDEFAAAGRVKPTRR